VRAAVVLVALGLLTTVVAVIAPAGAQSSGRVIDRTLVCATALSGGIHEIEIRGHSGIRASGATWKQQPFTVVASGGGTVANLLLDESLAFVTAGRPAKGATLEQDWRRSQAAAAGTLAINLRACKAAPRRIAFGREGLRGGALSQLGAELDCEVPRRVVIRARAVLTTPGALRRQHGFHRLTIPIREARLTVRTEQGRLFMDAQVFESGKTTLHTAKGCIRE
jgi:hypothetical protein